MNSGRTFLYCIFRFKKIFGHLSIPSQGSFYLWLWKIAKWHIRDRNRIEMQLISSRTSSPVDPVHNKIPSQQDCSISDIWHASTRDFPISLSKDQP